MARWFLYKPTFSLSSPFLLHLIQQHYFESSSAILLASLFIPQHFCCLKPLPLPRCFCQSASTIVNNCQPPSTFVMKTAIALTAFGLGASSIPSRPTSTIASGKRGDAFKLTGKGPASAHGLIGQLGDGQNRFGGGHPVGDYILKDGKVWDAHGRGCILTPPTTQWQCDEGATRKSSAAPPLCCMSD
jgi:hypothetical protein